MAIIAATDPRWVLAVRTAEQLQGSVLVPERRERLVRLGKVMGLSPFDANLVIAIVQDQARRGNSGGGCAAAAGPRLALVPPAGWDARRRRRMPSDPGGPGDTGDSGDSIGNVGSGTDRPGSTDPWRVAAWLGILIAIEAVALWLLWR